MRRFAPLLTAAALVAVALGCSKSPPAPSKVAPPAAADKPAEVAETPTQQARALAKLKRLAVAAHNYESAMGRFPAAATAGKDGKPLLSWRVALLTFLEDETPRGHAGHVAHGVRQALLGRASAPRAVQAG